MEENKTSQVEFQEENSVESSCPEEVKALTWKEKLKNMSKKQIAIFGGIAVAVIAIIIASIILLGGNNGDSSDGSENDGPSAEAIREVELGFAETTYDKLNSAAKTSSEVMRGIYSAWYYAIYESDEGYDFNRIWELADRLDCTYNDIELALTSLGYTVLDYDVFTQFNVTVRIAMYVYESKGKYASIADDMDFAKQLLQKISAENYEYTSHAKLTSYYSEIMTCYQYLESPTGSLTDLKNRILNFETKVSNYKNELSIALD